MGEDILDRIKASDRDAVSTGFRSSVQVLANEAATEIASLRERLGGAKDLYGQACGDYVCAMQRAERAEARLAWVLKQAERGDGIEAIKGPLGAWINRPILENNGLRDRKRIASGDSYEEAIDRAMGAE